MASTNKGWWSRQPLDKLPQPKVIKQFGPAIVRLATHRPHQPTGDPGQHRPLASMPRKGTATVKKKSSKWVSSSSEEDETSPVRSSGNKQTVRPNGAPVAMKGRNGVSDSENVDPAVAREQLKRSTEAHPRSHRADTPRQDLVSEEQSAALADALFPNEDGFAAAHGHEFPHSASVPVRSPQKDRAVLETLSRVLEAKPARPCTAAAKPRSPRPTADPNLTRSPQRSQPRPAPILDSELLPDRDLETMVQGGASIPPNQQRNMRACMVCSIVRTQQQFTTQGCPNCEDILELAGNPEQVNDCTSQVFEGLISVADTNRSWVARYQRLEGYVPGVYATQVEGILPEDILVAVENAGINYVPRDGSEQEMLGKD
jgi:transcription elongation factor SPT4